MSTVELATKLIQPSHFVNVLNSKMHYLESGNGDPIVFLHGIPTWSYTWRNVIPHLEGIGRCIAPDLIGMGRSDKPKIEYTIFDHIRYFEAFMSAMNLNNVSLVMHAWGAIIGFDYAMRYPEQIKSLVFFETPHVRPAVARDMLSLPIQELTTLLNVADEGRDMILNSHYYVDRILLSGVLRALKAEEKHYYREPFQTAADRQPIWQFLQEYPRGDNNSSPVLDLIAAYSARLQQSSIPKLMLYAFPGFVTPISSVEWAQTNFPNLTVVELGEALHLVQESKPHILGDSIREWLVSLNNSSI